MPAYIVWKDIRDIPQGGDLFTAISEVEAFFPHLSEKDPTSLYYKHTHDNRMWVADVADVIAKFNSRTELEAWLAS